MLPHIRQPTLPLKLVYLAIAVIFIMIGILGLIIPIIPGVLFLLGAVFMLSKASRRFKRWSDQQPTMAKIQEKLNRLHAVGLVSKIKVVALMGLEMMVSSVAQIASAARRAKDRFL